MTRLIWGFFDLKLHPVTSMVPNDSLSPCFIVVIVGSISVEFQAPKREGFLTGMIVEFLIVEFLLVLLWVLMIKLYSVKHMIEMCALFLH